MKFLENNLKITSTFEKGKPLEKFYPLYEALILYLTPGKLTKKRLMFVMP